MSYLNVDDNLAEPSPNARVPCMYIHRNKTADRLSYLLQLGSQTADYDNHGTLPEGDCSVRSASSLIQLDLLKRKEISAFKAAGLNKEVNHTDPSLSVRIPCAK
jgi:hypothetical protein